MLVVVAMPVAELLVAPAAIADPLGPSPPSASASFSGNTGAVSASTPSGSVGSQAEGGGGSRRNAAGDGVPQPPTFVTGNFVCIGVPGLVSSVTGVSGCAPITPGSAGAPPLAVNPFGLAVQARNQLVLPGPTVHTAPPSGRLVVQWQTWLWMDAGVWQPLSASASAGLVSATVMARPVRVRWDMGDGHVIVCDGPGTAWQPGVPAAQQHPSCSYVYRRSSAGQPDNSYVIRTSIDWSTSWVAAGAPGGGALDPAITTGSLAVQVGEVQALVTD